MTTSNAPVNMGKWGGICLILTMCLFCGVTDSVAQSDQHWKNVWDTIRNYKATGQKPQDAGKLANTFCIPDYTVQMNWIGDQNGVVEVGETVDLEVKITLNNDCHVGSAEIIMPSMHGDLIGEHLILENVDIEDDDRFIDVGNPLASNWGTQNGNFFFRSWEIRPAYVWMFTSILDSDSYVGQTHTMRMRFRAVKPAVTALSEIYVLAYGDFTLQGTFFDFKYLSLTIAPASGDLPDTHIHAFEVSPSCVATGKQFVTSASITNYTDETKYYRIRYKVGEDFLPMRFGLFYSSHLSIRYSHSDHLYYPDTRYPRPDFHFANEPGAKNTIMQNFNLQEYPIVVVPPGTFNMAVNGTGSAYVTGSSLSTTYVIEELDVDSEAPWEDVRSATVASTKTFTMSTNFCSISTSVSDHPEYVDEGEEVTFEFSVPGFHYKGIYGATMITAQLPDYLKIQDVEIVDYYRDQAIEGEVIDRDFLMRLLTYYTGKNADNGFIYHRNVSPDGNNNPPDMDPESYAELYKMIFRTHDDFKVKVTAKVTDSSCQAGNVNFSLSHTPYRLMPLDYEQNDNIGYFDFLYFDFLNPLFSDSLTTIAEKKVLINDKISELYDLVRNPLYYKVHREIFEVSARTRAPMSKNCWVAGASGKKWRDENGNAQMDAEEPGIAGWKISAKRIGGDPRPQGVEEASTLTDAQGMWRLEDLKPGIWEVWEEIPSTGHWSQTYPGAKAEWKYTVEIAGREEMNGLNFGNRQSTFIEGFVWEDKDANSLENTGEPRLSNWRVFLDLDGDGIWDDGEPWKFSGPNGSFRFDEPPAGSYGVRVEYSKDGGWRQSRPGPIPGGSYDLEVRPGWLVEPNNLAFGQYKPVTISGVKWRDRNGNGDIDNDEPLLEGWTIFLDLDLDGELGENEPWALTDNTGAYHFWDLDPGTFQIREVNQNGWVPTWPKEGFHEVALLSGEEKMANFGNATEEDARYFNNPDSFVLMGNVFYEQLEDGAWKPGETSVKGWVVHLEGLSSHNSHVRMSTTSDHMGVWRFSGMPEGRYRLSREARPDWVPAFPLIAKQQPAGQDHIIETVVEYVGIDSASAVLQAGPGQGWLHRLREGGAVMYTGLFADLDYDGDRKTDERLFFSGPMQLRWDASVGGRANWYVESLNLVGVSSRHGEIRANLVHYREGDGYMESGPSDSLAYVQLTVPLRLSLGGDQLETEFAGVKLDGQFAALPPYNQPLVATDTAAVMRNLFGRIGAQLLRLELHPLYAADFGLNNSIFGWAPETYPVTLEDEGARHVLSTTGSAGVTLGGGFQLSQLSVRTRGGASRQTGARGEDGVEFLTPLVPGSTAAVRVIANGSGSIAAWVDFNGDGNWDSNEKVIDGTVKSGDNTFEFMVPAGAHTGQTYARFRVAPVDEPLLPVGVVTYGEVEDYAIQIGAGSGSISGLIWEDVDGDGLRDPGEPALAGVTVLADLDGDGEADAFEPQALTDASGQYRFTGLAAGIVTLRMNPGGPWRINNPGGEALVVVDLSTIFEISGVDFGVVRTATAMDDDMAELPRQVELGQNYPNPFNPTTVVPFAVPKSGPVELAVYDALGRRVAILVDATMQAGRHHVSFDASGLPSGVYVIRLRAGGQVQTTKMTLMK